MKPTAILALTALLLALAGAARTPPAAKRTPPAAKRTPGESAADVLADLSEAQARRILAMSPLGPPVPDPTNAFHENEGAARLGQALFFDERLSRNGDVSCATCHDPQRSWTDGRTVAEGVGVLDRNTPSLWNVARNRWFFWDGRVDTLWAQALVPLESGVEHAGSRLQLAHLVHDDPELRRVYERLFGPMPELEDEGRFPPTGRPVPDEELARSEAYARSQTARVELPANVQGHEHGAGGSHFYHPHQRSWDAMNADDQAAVTRVFANLGKCIAAFVRKITSDRSPLDVFVEGLREDDPAKLAALSPSARRGMALFVGRAECHICHNGPDFTDGEFHDLGLPPPTGTDGEPLPETGRAHGVATLRASPFNARGPYSDAAAGDLVALDFLPQHAHGGPAEFKTPTLRNVATTAPYMHRGQFATLHDVVRFYSTRAGARTSPPTRETILHPLGLSDAEIDDLVAFLESLTGDEIDPTLARAPASPLD